MLMVDFSGGYEVSALRQHGKICFLLGVSFITFNVCLNYFNTMRSNRVYKDLSPGGTE